jgi:hypothetical protein
VQDSHKISVCVVQKGAAARTSRTLVEQFCIEGSEMYELRLDRAGEYTVTDVSTGKRTVIAATDTSSGSSSSGNTGSSSSSHSSTTGSSSSSSSSAAHRGSSSSTPTAPVVATSAATPQRTERVDPQSLLVTESECHAAIAAWDASVSADAADLHGEPTPLALLEGDLAGGDWRCDARDMPSRRRFLYYIINYYSHNWSSICQRVQALGAELRFDVEAACLIEAAHYSQAEHMLAYSFRRLYAIRIQALPASCLLNDSAPVTTLPTVLEQSPLQVRTALAPTATTAAAVTATAAAATSAAVTPVEQSGQRIEQQQQQQQQQQHHKIQRCQCWQ